MADANTAFFEVGEWRAASNDAPAPAKTFLIYGPRLPRCAYLAMVPIMPNTFLVHGGLQQERGDRVLNDLHLVAFEMGRWVCKKLKSAGSPFLYGHVGIWAQGRVYFFGGVTETRNMSNAVHIYDLASCTWSTAPDDEPPLNRAFHAAATIGEQVWIYGGSSDHNRTNAVNSLLRFDTSSLEWINFGPQDIDPKGRNFHHMCSMGNNLFIRGGRDADGLAVTTSFIVDIETLAGIPLDESALNLDESQIVELPVAGRTQVIAVGGKNGTNPGLVRELRDGHWLNSPGYSGLPNVLRSQRTGHATEFVRLPNRRCGVLVLGGRDGGGQTDIPLLIHFPQHQFDEMAASSPFGPIPTDVDDAPARPPEVPRLVNQNSNLSMDILEIPRSSSSGTTERSTDRSARVPRSPSNVIVPSADFPPVLAGPSHVTAGELEHDAPETEDVVLEAHVVSKWSFASSRTLTMMRSGVELSLGEDHVIRRGEEGVVWTDHEHYAGFFGEGGYRGYITIVPPGDNTIPVRFYVTDTYAFNRARNWLRNHRWNIARGTTAC